MGSKELRFNLQRCPSQYGVHKRCHVCTCSKSTHLNTHGLLYIPHCTPLVLSMKEIIFPLNGGPCLSFLELIWALFAVFLTTQLIQPHYTYSDIQSVGLPSLAPATDAVYNIVMAAAFEKSAVPLVGRVMTNTLVESSVPIVGRVITGTLAKMHMFILHMHTVHTMSLEFPIWTPSTVNQSVLVSVQGEHHIVILIEQPDQVFVSFCPKAIWSPYLLACRARMICLQNMVHAHDFHILFRGLQSHAIDHPTKQIRSSFSADRKYALYGGAQLRPMGSPISRKVQQWTLSDLQKYPILGSTIEGDTYLYRSYIVQDIWQEVADMIAVKIPLGTLCQQLNKGQLLYIAQCHSITRVTKQMSKANIVIALQQHSCSSCAKFLCTFICSASPVSGKERMQKLRDNRKSRVDE